MVGLIHRSVALVSIVLLRSVFVILRGWIIRLLNSVTLRRISVEVVINNLIARIVISERAFLAVVFLTVVLLDGG